MISRVLGARNEPLELAGEDKSACTASGDNNLGAPNDITITNK